MNSSDDDVLAREPPVPQDNPVRQDNPGREDNPGRQDNPDREDNPGRHDKRVPQGEHFLPAVRGLFVVYLGFTALVIVGSVFGGLPQRWWVVDIPAALVSAVCTGTAFSLVRRTPWSAMLTRVCAGCMLVTGLLLILLLATSVATLRGIAGPLGQGGVLVFLLVIALVLPYLVVMPVLMLLWVGPRQSTRPDAS